MINIPTYRAKKIDSEKYVEGYYFHQELIKDYQSVDEEERQQTVQHYIFKNSSHDEMEHEEGYFEFNALAEIDPSTLAINFPDMKDSNDKPIFASLSESGKGGDMFECSYVRPNSFNVCHEMATPEIVTAIYKGAGAINVFVEIVDYEDVIRSQRHVKVIGIQND